MTGLRPTSRASSWSKELVDLLELAEGLPALDQDVYLRRAEGFDEVVEGARTHAGHGRLDGAVARDHHHQRVLGQRGEAFEEIVAVTVRQTDVEHHQVKRLLECRCLGLRQALGEGDRELAAGEDLLQQAAHHRLVFHDKDFL
jgi:hypothetical protein